MRLLAIDYGKIRTGIAVSDSLQLIANGLTTVDTATLLPFLKDYFLKEKVEKIIIGNPKHLNNEPAEIFAEIEKFITVLENEFPETKIELFDERFTSKLAFKTMIDSGISKEKRKNKALIDKISATIILQDYMEQSFLARR
ncbi:MAG: Holliday junction resolvase RuvX [Prevotellaceae bacterium]|jgi:putative Holliday junction resolvase|nr:Holliday junction resolvase RuvX [Prevotellaceae bacterium]